jgi:NTE family protein
VQIDGEPYWDGGYCANPAVFPLLYDCQSSDVLLVLLSPLKHAGTPHSVQEIEARIAELSFSAHFMREMHMFAQAAAYSRSSWIPWGRWERRLQGMRFHMVDSSQLPLLERGETRLLAHGPFLELLKEQGRARASQWLLTHAHAIGRASSIDLMQLFG